MESVSYEPWFQEEEMIQVLKGMNQNAAYYLESGIMR